MALQRMISPRKILQAQGLRARKRLGQNFLANPDIAARIVEQAAIGPGDVVLEIGAGLGALTIPAARRARRVLAVDKDPRLFDLLREALAACDLANVTLIEGDFLKLHLAGHLPADDTRLIVLGNLPYNISSQIIVRLIRQRTRFQRAVLMLQREMADRLLAAPGGRDYGRLSVMLQYCATLRKVIDVDAVHFFPRPQVSSVVIDVRFYDRPLVVAENDDLLFKVVKAAFGQRRKTLRNALRGSFLDLAPGTVDAWLDALAIDPRRRAETLTVAEFVGLSNWLDRNRASSN
jgi:16S rRNA (adenine1518-N6/adenine1519-N6)-dimethyltransferase